MEETATINEIEHYFNLQRYETVIALATEALGENPENGSLWYLLGYSHYCLDHYDTAEQQLFEALRLGFDEAIIFNLLGNLYLITERWQKSEEMFLETLRLNPNDAVTHASYALLMKKTGNKKKAKLLIKRALELDPENPQVLRLHYILEGVIKGSKEQILALDQYINSNDSEYAKLIQLGKNAAFRKDVKEAKEHFRQAFLLKPEDENLLKILEEFEIASHPLLAPNRLVERLGGPAVLWAIGIGMIFLLIFLDFENLGILWIKCYMVFVLYTWISVPLVKLIRKVRD